MNVWFLYILWKWRSTKLIGLNFIDNVLCLMLNLQPIGDSCGMPDPWLPRGHELCGHCGGIWTRRVCSQCGNSGGSTVVRFFYLFVSLLWQLKYAKKKKMITWWLVVLVSMKFNINFLFDIDCSFLAFALQLV